jgi:uncharacterized membrane protein
VKNIAVILVILLGSFASVLATGSGSATAGRIGIAAVFVFTGIGHFAKRKAMAAMLPPYVPARGPVVLLSGVFELALAAGVVVASLARPAGIAIVAFLVLVTPINIWSAINKVPFGGHATGPKYLWVRIPLQMLLIAWTWWFAVRPA